MPNFTNNKYLLAVQLILVVVFFLFETTGQHAFAQPLQTTQLDNISRVYVFFDSGHSFVQKKDAFVSTNFITIDSNFSKDISTNVFGSEYFCKNMFYFSENKIIFYNPSQNMSSAVWCQVQLTNKKTQKIAIYKFILNKTFSTWCQEKDTNLSIGKTVNAILNIFESHVCNDNINPVLAETRVLNLSNSHLEDISPIAGFLQVRSLWLDNNEIENVDSLGSMRNLVFLSLNNNLISNARSLGEMPGLRWVFLNNNQIINIDFVHNLKTLKFLGINGNLIGDPTPLYSVSASTYVLANDNPFTKKLCTNNKLTKNSKNSKNKNSYFLKNCLENAALKPVDNSIRFSSVSSPQENQSGEQKSPEEASSSPT